MRVNLTAVDWEDGDITRCKWWRMNEWAGRDIFNMVN